eukprot:CAMPEP_0198129626 /NCGR_PEP_ID=MMETSP1442-20131203/52169_1 /TAXON_ID= /ORGANISM="Craspedostauros australis, Strain CCMP3328" /LENGTH=320 /DNA_ID=CAMNT_0043790057 /DNA_START=131 /DNA_END=1090 /DNA_ORIENTATION=+
MANIAGALSVALLVTTMIPFTLDNNSQAHAFIVTSRNTEHGVHPLRMMDDDRNSDDRDDSNDDAISRRSLFLKAPVAVGGAVIYGKLVSDSIQKLTRGDLVFPDDHERRVASTIATAFANCIPAASDGRPLRVLEVGIGKDLRVLRRNLYNDGFRKLENAGVTSVQLVGADLSPPSDAILADAKQRVGKQLQQSNSGVQVDIQVLQTSIESMPTFADGSFDCIVCCLTLCSVSNPQAAVMEMKRLLRPQGGTLAFVEHVAVNQDESYPILRAQQQVFDPLQQIVADNCHLRRETDRTVAEVFGNATRWLAQERFVVDGMW